MIDDTPTITAREMSEIMTELASGVKMAKALTEYGEEKGKTVPETETAFHAGAWWALQEAQMAIEVAMGIRDRKHGSPFEL